MRILCFFRSSICWTCSAVWNLINDRSFFFLHCFLWRFNVHELFKLNQIDRFELIVVCVQCIGIKQNPILMAWIQYTERPQNGIKFTRHFIISFGQQEITGNQHTVQFLMHFNFSWLFNGALRNRFLMLELVFACALLELKLHTLFRLSVSRYFYFFLFHFECTWDLCT